MKKNIKITTKFLKSINACNDGVEWVAKYKDKEPIAVIRQLVADDKWDWANWLIMRIMEYKQYVQYAVFAALQVIDIFEKEYPNDKRPRIAIEAAQKCINQPTQKNKDAAYAAAPPAYAAYAAAAPPAYAAAYAAAAAASAAMKTKIIEYGFSLFK